MFSARNRSQFRRAKRRFIRKGGLRRSTRRPTRRPKRRVKVGRVTPLYKSVSGGFPKQMTVKLTYFDQQIMVDYAYPAPSNGIVYRANSVYDPTYAITGRGNVSANLHPVYSQIYNQYCVLSSKITMAPVEQIELDSCYFGMFKITKIDPAHATFDTINDIYVLPNSQATPPRICGNKTAGGLYPAKNTKCSLSANTANDFSVKYAPDDPQLVAWYNENPTSATYYVPFISGFTASATARAFMIKIEYIVQYMNRKDSIQQFTLTGDDPNVQTITGTHQNSGVTGPMSNEDPWSIPVMQDTVLSFDTNGAGDRIIFTGRTGTTLGV